MPLSSCDREKASLYTGHSILEDLVHFCKDDNDSLDARQVARSRPVCNASGSEVRGLRMLGATILIGIANVRLVQPLSAAVWRLLVPHHESGSWIHTA